MKEYDIYLKKRIHESSLLIYSIPYRISVSATNRLILEAMLRYNSLQKFIAAESEFVIHASETDNMAEKRLEISTQLGFYCKMAAAAISHFNPESGISVAVVCNAGLKRYRLLSDMDDLTLSDLDDFTLGELDYVELT